MMLIFIIRKRHFKRAMQPGIRAKGSIVSATTLQSPGGISVTLFLEASPASEPLLKTSCANELCGVQGDLSR